MKKGGLFLVLFVITCTTAISQKAIQKKVFTNQLINFGKPDSTNVDPDVIRLQGGRVVLKKVTAPLFPNGTDVNLKMVLRSNGDKWDKSGSCFVVTNPELISIIDASKGDKKFPEASFITEKHGGVLSTDNYKAPVELLRFMTPFGVGYYSDNKVKYRRPVYIPKWEKEVVWNQDISHLEEITTGTFYVGVFIDCWVKKGYKVDLSLNYSGRAKKKQKVMPLVNAINYVKGQGLPHFFAEKALEFDFKLDKNIKNAKLHYITTGHGGHSGGDEFIKIKNSVYFNTKLVLDTIPWRDDCASFRRFNPHSGVWIRKDSAYTRNRETKERELIEIKERLASSDLSRSNWCPGSKVEPYVVSLGDLSKGEQNLKIRIPATKMEKGKANHWLVSAYLTYDN